MCIHTSQRVPVSMKGIAEAIACQIDVCLKDDDNRKMTKQLVRLVSSREIDLPSFIIHIVKNYLIFNRLIILHLF